jgi:hypothetical protein
MYMHIYSYIYLSIYLYTYFFFFFFITVIHKVYEPSIQARLGTAARFCQVVAPSFKRCSAIKREEGTPSRGLRTAVSKARERQLFYNGKVVCKAAAWFVKQLLHKPPRYLGRSRSIAGREASSPLAEES